MQYPFLGSLTGASESFYVMGLSASVLNMVRPSSHKNLHHISIGSCLALTVEHTHTHTFNGPLSGTTRVGRYQKGKTSLDFTEATDSEWQWHQLDHMQVYISLQADNHASTPPLSFLQA